MTDTVERCECGCILTVHVAGLAYRNGMDVRPGPCMAYKSVDGSPFAHQCECRQYCPMSSGSVEDESPSGAEVVVQ